MAAVSGEMCTGPGEIRKQLHQFLQGTSSSGPVSFETLSNSALFLLRTVPVARHAVLKHYALSFDDTINAFLSYTDRVRAGQAADPEAAHRSQLTALQDVTGVLLSFIKSNPEAWAPVVSSWALTLLGDMSSKYASKRGVQHATSLNEVLQMWLACPPAKMLIEITTECFAAMVGGAPDMCVDSLLEASVKYSPHFDWVVAHIGSCFPRTIITRVLNCGLKDFCSSGEKDGGPSQMKVPKMASVVGILGHLASKHSQDIRKALMALFEASLQSESQSNRVTTLPFLLQLASMSSLLLHILTTDLVAVLNASVLNQLHRQFTHWKRSSPGEYNSFLNLVVHLIGKSKSGTKEIINFVIQTAAPKQEGGGDGEMPVEEVKDTCVEIMHILLFELQRGVLSKKGDGSVVDIPLLTGLASQTDWLTNTLLHHIHFEGNRAVWLQQLLTFTALQAGETCAASILANVVFQAQTYQQHLLFYKLIHRMELGIPTVAKAAMVHIFNKLEPSSSPSSLPPASTSASATSSKPTSSTTPTSTTTATASSSNSSHLNTLRILTNLQGIVRMEKHKLRKKHITCSAIIEVLRQRHQVLCGFLLSSDPEINKSALELMNLVGFPSDLSTALLTQLCGVLTLTFFTSLHMRAHPTDKIPKAFRITQQSMSCIQQLSCFPFTRSLLIHYLIEGAVQKEHCHLFGGRWSLTTFSSSSSITPAAATSKTSSTVTDTVSLIEENREQSLSIALPRFHSSVYHGGVIRQSVMAHTSGKLLPKELVTRNCLTFTEALWLCGKETRQAAPPKKEPSTSAPSTSKAEEKDEPMNTEGSQTSIVSQSLSEGAARTLGCAIVDILTLDSLYNDVHWQDPDFRRVTTERDTLVWKRLEELPLLWSVIQEFSSSCVFLYYLSPVLRSLMSVVMNHLEVSRERHMKNCPKHHEGATKLVHCLAQGFMVPPPLSNVSELFPFVSPYEGYLLLLTLWRYIKDNPPSEFEKEVKSRTCDSSHMFVVNSIIHANIDHMGHLCSRFFNM